METKVLTDYGNEICDVPAWEEQRIGTQLYFVNIDKGIAIRKGDYINEDGLVPIYNITTYRHIDQEEDEEVIKEVNEKLEVIWK